MNTPPNSPLPLRVSPVLELDQTNNGLVNYFAACGLSLPIQNIFRCEEINSDALDIILQGDFDDLDWLHSLHMTPNDWHILNKWKRHQALTDFATPELVYPDSDESFDY